MKTELTLEALLEAIHKRGVPAKTLPAIPKAGGVFRPMAYRPRRLPSRDVVSMACEPTGYGLVVHLSCGFLGEEGIYSVSDPVTGARVMLGKSPGRDAALDALAECVRGYYVDHPRGDYRRALQASREVFGERSKVLQKMRD